ncbi:MAG: hypothetical protein JWN73_3920 [Betaproteobacteria bacterium]|nr:hypothetical protein [Betaproteobacteria bacterium]
MIWIRLSGMIESTWSKLRSRAAGSGLDLVDLMLTVIFGTGSAGALAFGKFLLGGLFAALAFGVYARLVRRKKE